MRVRLLPICTLAPVDVLHTLSLSLLIFCEFDMFIFKLCFSILREFVTALHASLSWCNLRCNDVSWYVLYCTAPHVAQLNDDDDDDDDKWRYMQS